MRLFRGQIRFQERLVGFFGAFSREAIDHPVRVLVMAAVVTLVAAPGIARLKLRTDGHALVSPTAPEVVYDQAIRDRFGIEDPIIVVVRSSDKDGIFNPGSIQLIRDLTAALARMPGINPTNVMSLATEPSHRLRPGTLLRQTLLEPPLKSKAELDQLREDLRKIELYTGTFVSTDGKSAAILIGAPGGGDRTRLYQRIREVIAARGPTAEELMVTGAPVAEALLGTHILEDLGVPRQLLGTSTRAHTEKEEWKVPASWYELRLFIARHIGLVPVVVVVMMLVFLLTFRNVLAMLLPLPGVVATLLFVFGLMGWSGVPIYLTIAVMPVLLTATGVTNDIYLFSRYYTLLREKPGLSQVEVVRETFDTMVCPVVSTSLTTGVGFLSFGLSPLAPVRAFGILSGIGVVFGLLCSLTVVPALLTLTNPAWLRRGSRRGAEPFAAFGAWFGRLGLVMVRWRWRVVAFVLLLTALTPLGVSKLAVQDSWTEGFDPGSEFRRATQRVNEDFRGMHLLLVACDAPQVIAGEVGPTALSSGAIVLPGDLVEDPAVIAGGAITISVTNRAPAGDATNAAVGAVWRSHIETAARRGDRIYAGMPVKDIPASFWPQFAKAGQAHFEVVARSHVRPEIIRSIAGLGDFIRERRQYAVGGVLTPADYLATTRQMVRWTDPNGRRLPEEAGEIKLLWDYYRMARGPQRLREVVDTNYWQSLTTVFLKNANFRDTAKLMSDIRAYEREHLAPKGIRVGFAGDVAVSQSLIAGIVSTQLQSLFWSLLGIYAITAVLGGSWRWGVYCVLPSALAVLIKFAVMGWLGIPLGVATSMFAAMTLGIGVNCAIQLLEGYGQARAGGAPSLEAANRAMALTGPPALVNTIAVSLGFGVLMLSQVPANARLGLLVVVGLVNCFVMSLLLLPVLLHWWPLKGKEAGARRKLRRSAMFIASSRRGSQPSSVGAA
jgi:predicted RND superfamily exporter protein